MFFTNAQSSLFFIIFANKTHTMRNYNLGFISNEVIYSHVKETVQSYRREITLEQFNENIIDPIKLTFDAKVYGKTIHQAIEDECFRQIDKSNTNRIGYFHQNLFRYAGNGWVVPKEGFDVQNDNLHIYAELKNKHNTMNSASAHKTYIKMQAKLLEDDESICYLVEAIARKSQDISWEISIDKSKRIHKKIRRISMDKFYTIVFQDQYAFYKLCRALPLIIEDVVKDNHELSLKNSVFEQLSEQNADILTSLYVLAFATYEGFEKYIEQ